MNIFDFQKRLNDFDIETEVVNTIYVTDRDIVRLIKTQMAFGQSGNNKPITNRYTHTTHYSVLWGEYRKTLGLQTDFYDLKVTGSFTSKIEVFSITPESFSIDSQDIKTGDITDMFGKAIMNLNDESHTEYKQSSFYPELKRRIESKLGVKFG